MKKFYCFLMLFLLLFAACGTTEETKREEKKNFSDVQATEFTGETNNPTPTLTVTPTITPTVTPMPDVTAPVLTLLGEESMEIPARSTFFEPGFSAIDDFDGDISEKVTVCGNVDVNLCGTYLLTYTAEDAAGNRTQKERTIIVKQPEERRPEGKVIYLTFDDGPGRYTDDLLDILEKYEIKATFFTCGNGQPKLITKIHEAGHSIGIHCRNHDYTVVYASEEAYFEDLFYMQDLIYECTGDRTTLVRFPGGSSNKVSSFNPGIMSRLTEQLEQMGFQYFDWNVSSGDSGTKDTQKILNTLISETQKRECAVVLAHAETREFSLNAVEDFIIWALENGYRFMTIDETSPRMHHTVAN